MKKLTTREFNNSLCPEARTRLVDFKTFIVHDKIALLLAKVPDKRYRFSGNNKRLLEVFQTKNPRVFKEYCDKNLRD